jgi:two-component system, LuxR family, response regulator FixJ
MADIGLATVFVVDDDCDTLDSVCLLVESVGLQARGYGSAPAFLDDLDLEAHGCIVTDIRMPGMSGLELQKRLQALGATLPIIVLTAFGDVPVAVRAMKQGAVDFVEKPYQPDELLERIQAAIDQDSRRHQARRLASEVRLRVETLSPREREVMERVAGGAANKVVAMELGISERTVEIHRARVMKKMAVRSLAELVTHLQQQAHAGGDDDRPASPAPRRPPGQ